MAQSKFNRLISALSPGSIRALKNYLRSPVVNKNEKMVDFFELLVKHKDPDDDKGKSKIFQKLWPDRKFTSNKFDQYKTQLTKLILDFLAFQSFQSNPKRQLVNRLQELLSLSLDNDFHSAGQELNKLMEEEATWSGDDFLIGYESTYLLSDLLVRQAWRGPIPLWEEGYQHLHHFYVLQKLKLACAVRNQALIFHTELPAWVNDPDLVQPVPADADPVLLSLYRSIHFSLIEPENFHHYEQLADGLTQHGQELAHHEVMDVYLHALNHCIRRLIRGESEAKQEMKRLYLEMRTGDRLLSDGKIPWPLFKNLFVILFTVDKAEAEQFLEDFHGKVLEDDKQSTFNYCQAVLTFSKGQIQEASRKIRLVMEDGKDIFYKLDARVLQMCCWFLLEEWSLLESEYEAFRNQLVRPRKTRFSEGHLKHYYRFNHFLHRLGLNVQELPGEKRERKLEKLAEEIKAETLQIPMKGWLLQQIEKNR